MRVWFRRRKVAERMSCVGHRPSRRKRSCSQALDLNQGLHFSWREIKRFPDQDPTVEWLRALVLCSQLHQWDVIPRKSA